MSSWQDCPSGPPFTQRQAPYCPERLHFTNCPPFNPPYYNGNAEWNDLPRQWLRKYRKWRGLPSSPNVGVLAEMLGKLKVSIDSFLGALGPVEVAFVTIPYLPALYMEDLVNASKYIGVRLMILL